METQERTKQTYYDEFLSLKCCGDVLNVVNPVQGMVKEITESMGMLKRIKKIALRHPKTHSLWDFCAGNALTSVTAQHLLPIRNSYAVDKRNRERDWAKVRNFEYVFSDIYGFDKSLIKENSIICGVHACGNLSKEIINIFNNSKAKYLVLMPCCVGSYNSQFNLSEINRYMGWCLNLFMNVDGQKSITKDEKVLSPKNIIITSEKK